MGIERVGTLISRGKGLALGDAPGGNPLRRICPTDWSLNEIATASRHHRAHARGLYPVPNNPATSVGPWGRRHHRSKRRSTWAGRPTRQASTTIPRERAPNGQASTHSWRRANRVCSPRGGLVVESSWSDHPVGYGGAWLQRAPDRGPGWQESDGARQAPVPVRQSGVLSPTETEPSGARRLLSHGAQPCAQR